MFGIIEALKQRKLCEIYSFKTHKKTLKDLLSIVIL
jgi:hypothetical protein